MDFFQTKDSVDRYHQTKELQAAETQSNHRFPDQEAQWNELWRNCSNQDGQDWLLGSLLSAFESEYWRAKFMHLLYYQATVLVPLLSYYIFQNLNDRTFNSSANIILVVAVGLIKLAKPFLRAAAEGLLRKIGQNMQEILSRAMLRKTMRVCVAQGRVESSELLRMMQVDMEKMAAYPLTSSYVSCNMYCIVFNVMLIVWLFGWAGLAGIGTLLATLLLRVFIKNKADSFEEEVGIARNQRVRESVEMLGVIKLVKVRALEGQWWGRLMGLREAELEALHRKNKFEMLGVLALACSVRLVILVVCLLLIRQQSFGSAAIFTLNYIFINLNFHSLIISLAAIKDTKIALKAIQKFLSAKEINTSHITRSFQSTDQPIIVQNGNFYWEHLKKDDQNQTQNRVWLLGVGLRVRRRELVAVVGRFGSGKTSLLQAILGEMRNGGESRVALHGHVAYVAQKPWILSGTVRDNILFGAKFKQERYSAALHYACMHPDLQVLSDGDQTLIGERGCTLSGGQKARVALARALYADADILLLDDILSAVDAHVGAFLFNETLRGYLRGKAVILVTHALNFVKQADRVIVIEDGRIMSNGTFKELSDHCLLPSFELSRKKREKEADERQVQEVKMDIDKFGPETESKEDVLSLFFKQSGGLQFQVLSWVFVAITSGAVLILGLEINEWANAPDNDEGRYVLLYLLLVGFISCATLLLFYYVFHSPILMNVYRGMVTGMLFAPLSYFDTTPASKLICRLSSDLAMLDKIVLVQYFSFTTHVAYAGCFALSIIYGYWRTQHYGLFVVFAVFFGLLLYRYGRYLEAVKAHRQAEEQLRIPINSYFAETVQGQATIRAFGKIAENERGFAVLQGQQGRMRETVDSIEIFINFVISLSTTFYLLLLLTYFFTTDDFTQYDVFLLASIFSLEEYLQRVNQNIMELLVKLKCLTKCNQLAKIPPEHGYIELATRKDGDDNAFQQRVIAARDICPFQSGEIVFQNVCAAYRPELGDALRSLSFSVRPGEKVGIVGRTGSGKSTLLLAFLRIIELRTGTITIGGLDCAKMGLSALRSNISVILQDHFLFAGTVRDNVDPSRNHSDQAIEHVLKLCKLWEGLERREGLNTVLVEGGENFSVGERQLLNIARALLHKGKIVLVDEATASVDSQTDAEIQDVLRMHFSGCTLLTIAHRLDSVAHCDRILVLQNGELKEFDSPASLLERKSSLYRQLCEQTTGKL